MIPVLDLREALRRAAALLSKQRIGRAQCGERSPAFRVEWQGAECGNVDGLGVERGGESENVDGLGVEWRGAEFGNVEAFGVERGANRKRRRARS